MNSQVLRAPAADGLLNRSSMLERGIRWKWFIWPLILIAIGVLVWREQRASSANGPSLEPQFSLPAGAYDHDIQLSIDAVHPETEIFFTLDGRIPDPATATQYMQPILLSADFPQTVVIRAQAFLPDGTSGPLANATYFVGMETSLPMLSIIVDPDDFWDDERGIYVNHWQRGREWERPIDLTYVAADREAGFHIGAGVRVHGGWTRFFSDKKSLRLYFRDLYGARKLEFPLFGEEGQIAFDNLVLHNSSKDFQLFENQLVERLADQMGGFMTRSQPVLLFINGRPWGIYQIRERIDQRLLDQNYGVPAADITDTPNNRGMQSEEQLAVDTVHWENFMDFVLANDLTDPANFATLQTQIDLENFVDYYLLQMFVANTDWPHHNVQQFRPRTQGGRWEWIVWDNDLAFERVDRQMVDHVLSVEHPLGERMVILFNKLLANPEFRSLFITRAADLLNTTLATSNVQAHINELAGELEPDTSFERERWDLIQDWVDIVAYMGDYAEQRPDIMRDHMVESLELPGTARLSFNQTDGETGWIVVNDTAPQQLPWQGIYFLDSTIRLQAIPPAGYAFSGWEGFPGVEEGDSNPISMIVEGDMSISPRFAPLEPDVPRSGDVTITAYHVDDTGQIEGDWFDLQVQRAGGVDLRGWRVTDNDSVAATDEGSLIFVDDPLLANLSPGTIVRVMATKTPYNTEQFPFDGGQNGIIQLYVGNGLIDEQQDPWFNLGTRDNLVLLAPGPTVDLADDIPVAFWSDNSAVTPASFGLPYP
jgi:hypothetical protein